MAKKKEEVKAFFEEEASIVEKPVKRVRAPRVKATKTDEYAVTEPTSERKAENGNPATTMVAVLVTALIVGGAIYAWQQQTKEKTINKTAEEALETKSKLETELDNLKNMLSGAESEKEALKSDVEDLSGKAELLNEAKLEFVSEELGIAFEYPAILGQVDLTIATGTNGAMFRATFSNNPNISFGGLSADYANASSSSFLDTKGYKKAYYKYYFKEADNDYGAKLEPIKIVYSQGEEFVIIDGSSFLLDENEAKPVYALAENSLGALVNLNNADFSGLAFLITDKESVNLDTLEQILKSLVIN